LKTSKVSFFIKTMTILTIASDYLEVF
jgi:hypothetical protein